MKNTTQTFKLSRRFLAQVALGAFALAITVAPAFSHAAVLTRSLGIGSTGSDVSALQVFLAKDVTLYPQGLITGYYGFLTKSAVSNFQSRNNISPVGVVGPVTLPVLNAQMGGGTFGDASAPVISGVSTGTAQHSATVAWTTNDSATGTIYYSTAPLSLYEQENSVAVSGAQSASTDTSLRTYQSVALSNLASNTTYFYMIYSTDQAGNVSVSVPSTFHTIN